MKKIFDQSQMQDLAIELARNAKDGNVFALIGTLGAGKSFFCQHFINSLMDEKTDILSPTFNLLFSYQTSKCPVHHFDLYRLKSSEELEEIGFFDCLKNGICLVEWPEIALDFLPKNHIKIEIKIINDDLREVSISNN
ncbi:MAG: tRNA threonylcarbamoyladenosine biosynthesis protein TsaE [Lentimonas sp.]|jgi:tRNA threonylcarbamoyladenosine biosynthesis protein TsaE